MPVRRHWTEVLWPNGVPTPDAGGQPEWDTNDYTRDFEWLGISREGHSMADQQPSVGRVVHYVAYGTPGGEFPAGVCRAAIITEVDPAGGEVNGTPVPTDANGHVLSVGVCVLNPSGFFFNRHIPYDEAKMPGSWHWPERI